MVTDHSLRTRSLFRVYKIIALKNLIGAVSFGSFLTLSGTSRLRGKEHIIIVGHGSFRDPNKQMPNLYSRFYLEYH
jgi:hypothetical protein